MSLLTVAATFFLVAVLSVLGSAQAVSASEHSGGFGVVATSRVGLSSDVLSAGGGSSLVGLSARLLPERAYRTEREDGARATVPYPVRLAAATDRFAQAQRFRLTEHEAQYPTAAAALRAVVVDGDKAVVDRYSLPEGARVGDDVVLSLGGGERRFRLIAVLDTFVTQLVLVAPRPYAELVGDDGPTMFFARSGSASAVALAGRLESQGRNAGVEALTVTEIADKVVAANRRFTDLFELILILGLVVAVVATGSGVARSARERGSEIAVLRAIGCRRSTVALSLAAEPLLTTGLGAVVGVGVGLLDLRFLFFAGLHDYAFRPDLQRLGLFAGSMLLLLGTVCWSSAWSRTWTRHDPIPGFYA